MKREKTHISSKSNIFFMICGISMFLSELWKQWYITFRLNSGAYQWWYFPFQLCSIAMYVLLVLPLIKKIRLRAALLTFLMCYSLLGGIAVFADTSGLQYPVICLTVHSYSWHILLIVIGITAGVVCLKEHLLGQDIFKKRDLEPARSLHLLYRTFIDSTLLYLACCFFATIINLFADSHGLINMFYINPDYKMQQIGFSTLVKYLGNGPAILIYVLSTILGAFLLFHIWKRIYKSYQQR